MPTIDGGHVFLSVLAPIRRGAFRGEDGVFTSPEIALRAVLASLPTARQSGAVDAGAPESPFSRNTLNHFVRMAVISAAAFNGRDHSNAIGDAIRKVELTAPGPSDVLASSYLFWAADFDVGDDPQAAQETYLDTLWWTMEPELRAIFGYCVGFEAVRDASGFRAWIARCQLETTMPFNDYSAHPSTARPPGLLAKLGALVFGTRFPTAPNSDLPSVLKALYLQRRFVPFAVANQGASDDDLYRAFGAFMAACNPAGPAPTQAPGELGG